MTARLLPAQLSRLASLALPLAFGCGGAAPAPQAPTAPSKESAAAAVRPVDTSPVEAPKGLIALARLRKPSTVLRVVTDWMHLPGIGREMVSELVMGESVGALLDLDQSVDLAVATEPSKHSLAPLVAVSASVGSMDAAKGLLSPRFKLTPADGGAYVVEDTGGDKGDEPPERVCELLPSAGASSARLVCASGTSAIRVLGPYLTRTLPREDVPSDMHLEVRFEP